MTRALPALLFALALLLASAPLAGGRGRYGGVLQVALVAPASPVTPASADAPVDALRLALTHQPLCRLVTFSRPGPRALRLELLPGVDPALVTAQLARVRDGDAPARSLLANVAAWSTSPRTVDLELSGPAPALERALCHPAFSLPLGPFRAKGARLEPVDAQPSGRPWLDGVALQVTDARTAERLLAQRKVHLAVGVPGQGDAPQLFATALRLGPGAGGPFRAAVESTLDRGDLARFFVAAPAEPLTALVPLALGLDGAPFTRSVRLAPLSPVRDLALFFDDAAEHERAIAQRLQVKLQPLGYRLALKPTPREALRARALAENEVALVSVLLPPTAVGTLQLWCDVAGQRARLPALLQQLGAAADPEAKARELAVSLGAELPLVPLVTRGLGLVAAPDVQHLGRDEVGLPRLDDVFLSPE
jgi:hypothetical protein